MNKYLWNSPGWGCTLAFLFSGAVWMGIYISLSMVINSFK